MHIVTWEKKNRVAAAGSAHPLRCDKFLSPTISLDEVGGGGARESVGAAAVHKMNCLSVDVVLVVERGGTHSSSLEPRRMHFYFPLARAEKIILAEM